MHRPHMLVKIRSDAIMQAIGGKLPGGQRCLPMPCTLRIASLVPGLFCSGADTVIGCHTGSLGKGMSTKVSDMDVAAGCRQCHDLLDRVDHRWVWLKENRYPDVLLRVQAGRSETMAMLIERGVVTVPDATLI